MKKEDFLESLNFLDDDLVDKSEHLHSEGVSNKQQYFCRLITPKNKLAFVSLFVLTVFVCGLFFASYNNKNGSPNPPDAYVNMTEFPGAIITNPREQLPLGNDETVTPLPNDNVSEMPSPTPCEPTFIP